MSSPDPIQARLRRPRRISSLWVIPIVTLFVALVMAYQNYLTRGPQITIQFKSAAGIEAGRTLIKTLDVEVGRVEDITLNGTLDGVVVVARIHGEFRDLLAEDSRFWVIQPSVSLAGVSGLNTLISGQYIEFSPGTAARLSENFVGLDEPPLTPPGTPGMHVTLVTDGDFSFARGDRVQHQGTVVGKIEDIRYDFVAGRTYYDAFIEAPFHELITSETRFWKTSGIQAELSSEGVRFEAGTLDALLRGGVSFVNPNGVIPGETPPPVQSEFYVYPSRSAIEDRQYNQTLRYWIMVSGSVGGLTSSSRVMYRGLQIGRVVSTDNIPPGSNLLDRTLELPVLIEIQPGRLGLPDTEDGAERARLDIENWIREGLVATIGSQNFLVGQQQVELQYQEGVRRDEVRYFNDLAVIPTDLGSIGRFTNSIESLLVKLNQLPVEDALQGITDTTREATAALQRMQELLDSTQELVGSERTTALMEQLEATLAALQSLADTYSAESNTTRDVQRMLDSIADLMTQFRPLAEELRNRPNSLVFPGSPPTEVEPTRRRP
jgi:Paraquat-inducible protein B